MKERHIPIEEYAELQGYNYKTLPTNKKARTEFLAQQKRLIKLLKSKGFVEAALIHGRKRKQLQDQLNDDLALLAD
ncbi:MULTISPECIES: hypothetical protein [unclassified Sinorhizobium]|jgi:hypothetical protein|uniref:hypothetical protein n=1 Tax=unclassified Sinorhizobium TaxID=2613772 RepID=UPI0023D86730|nr:MULTISPECIES: hypothetical protein [unclassified Sinorhizobium]WEJ13456.1 hypothetical protein N0Q90_25960 [Sinorhizobium sp. M103]WEJ18552.1 hypothetical protein N0Q91_23955 [Sinorhizobium sp. K101]WEJ39514.1 hypothetical protein N0R80_20245 [Sinorhizobium sp. C101]